MKLCWFPDEDLLLLGLDLRDKGGRGRGKGTEKRKVFLFFVFPHCWLVSTAQSGLHFVFIFVFDRHRGDGEIQMLFNVASIVSTFLIRLYFYVLLPSHFVCLLRRKYLAGKKKKKKEFANSKAKAQKAFS